MKGFTVFVALKLKCRYPLTLIFYPLTIISYPGYNNVPLSKVAVLLTGPNVLFQN